MLNITRQVSTDSASADKAVADKIASDKLAADKLAADKAAAEKRVVPVAGQTIKDCADCPEMVVIPAGSFMMGSPDIERGRQPDGREGPVHEVRIGYPYALGKHEVTRGEFSRFAAASGYKTEAERTDGCAEWDGKAWVHDASKNWRNPGFPQTDSHPVVCVSWNDAQAYLTWLNKKVPGKGFRLPSEAEWEYAARAGQGTARYPWGDDLTYSRICDFANGMDATGKAQVPGVTWTAASCSDGHAYTAPAGSFKANAFGLYDMHGNAWEWMQDVWHENYQGVPRDGSAWVNGGDPARRVLRGGAWFDYPGFLRSVNRGHNAPGDRYGSAGMRIARTH
jgi:formylglycine-generating enzyme required for sulfatase activity